MMDDEGSIAVTAMLTNVNLHSSDGDPRDVVGRVACWTLPSRGRAVRTSVAVHVHYGLAFLSRQSSRRRSLARLSLSAIRPRFTWVTRRRPSAGRRGDITLTGPRAVLLVSSLGRAVGRCGRALGRARRATTTVSKFKCKWNKNIDEVTELK